MNTTDTQAIVRRFFLAIDSLIATGELRGRATFTREHDINRRNFGFIAAHPESGMFQTAWLTYLVRDYDISPRWLLTGFGNMQEQQRRNAR